MNRVHLLWLTALALALVFVALDPLLSFPVFGSDTGEYYRLTAALVRTGHLPLASYSGWGSAYQDFPGIFILAAATSQSLGVDPLSALQTSIPVVSVLSVAPLFLLFRRLFGHESIALLGAGLATVIMPRMFSLAHPAPVALGDFLVVGALWMFVEGRRDRRWYLPLSIAAAALIVTHHLSSYFFLLSALGGLLLLELIAPRRWSRRFPARELAFLGAFSVGLLVYWFDYASAFRPIIASGLGVPPVPALAVMLTGLLGAILVVGALVRWRRALPRRRAIRPVRLPTDRTLATDFAILFGGTVVGVTALLLSPLPGASHTTSVAAVAFFLPLLLLIGLGAGSRRLVLAQRLGPFALTWLAVIGLSTMAGWASQSQVILPNRHVEYLLIPVGLLAAAGIGRLVARWGDRSGRRGIAAGIAVAVLILAGNAAIAYPPPEFLGGFEEGLTNGDAALWMWAGIGLPTNATVASDHRVSSMIFGFDGNPATWDSTPALFTGSDRASAFAELAGSLAPHGALRPVDAVAVDQAMIDGVALDPGGAAYPLSDAARSWLAAAPFVPIYENGPEIVYWVAGPIAVP